MDALFKSRRQLLQFVCFWVWFCFALLGSSLTDSALVWNKQPTSQTVETGSTVTFECSATFDRKIEYHWLHENQDVLTDIEPRFTVKADGTLQITNTKLEDRGTYQCYVTRVGRDKILGRSNPATLTVKGICSSVQLTIKPTGDKFLTGTDLMLRCKCYMNPSGTYTFTKDGSPVAEGGRITKGGNKLYINNATEGDSGTYSCSATSQDSLVTKKPTGDLSFTVIVGKYPQFQLPPRNKYVVQKGKPLTITCKAIGNPEPVIKWHFKDDPSPLQNNSEYSIHKSGSMEIKNVSSQDAGNYKCTAENMVGTIAKDTVVELAFLGDVSLEKSTIYVMENDKTEVLCIRPKGSPEPSITWLKADSQPLPKRFGVKGCCTLLNNKTRLNDDGEYTCTAKNIFGTSSKTVKIIVSVPPTITIKPDDQTVIENEKVYLDCLAKSTPAAKISWMKDDNPVKLDSEHMLYSNGTLFISQAKPSDSGTYKCLADHPGGWTDSAMATLTVKGIVKLDGIPVYVVNANLHKPHKIECDFDGDLPITVNWKKEGGMQIRSNDRIKHDNSVLYFKRIEKEDQGRYWCTGENDFSQAQSYVNLSVYVYPTFDLRPKNTTAYVDDHIWLHCNASGDPKPKISWSKEAQGGDQLDPDRFIQHANGTLHIKQVRMEDRGRYYCIAANHAEMKQSKFSLEVQDKQRVGLQAYDQPPPKPDKSSAGSMARTIGIAVGCAAAYIVLVVGLMIYCKGRRAKQSKAVVIIPPECENLNANGDIEHHGGDANDMTMNPIYRSQPSYDKMEFPRHDLDAIRSLGNGAYGRAFLARASGIRDGEKETVVVVKALSSNDDQVREEFNKEMEALCGLQHDNVVSLLGVCKDDEPLYMIFESMEKDLKQFLLSCYDNGRSTMNSNQKLAICGQVASGMNYLNSENFIHKDLAARNCMIGRDLQVKIGFLSLSYDLYNAEYYRFNNMHIPLRWMPPEAIFDDEFSEKSDVWSYGVLVWEIYTLGQMPYHDRSNEEVLKCVKDDLRLPKPDNCPDTVLEVLDKCWEGNPLARPTFQELLDDVNGISVDSHV